MGGWGIVAADVIVMASLAQIAGKYGFLLFGADGLAENTAWVTLVGCLWIAALTYVCYRGIEVSAKFQFVMLAVEVVFLVAFSLVALIKVYTNHALDSSVKPGLSWLNPFKIASFDGSQSTIGAFSGAILLAVFIYWGWDSAVSVNEETKDPATTPGRAAVISTLVLLLTYAVVSIATMAFAGPQLLIDNSDDVFQRGRRPGPRQRAGQVPDLCGAHLRGSLDADDDPADGTHHLVDGRVPGAAGPVREDAQAVPDADYLHHRDGCHLDRLLRPCSPGSRTTSSATPHRPSAC